MPYLELNSILFTATEQLNSLKNPLKTEQVAPSPSLSFSEKLLVAQANVWYENFRGIVQFPSM